MTANASEVDLVDLVDPPAGAPFGFPKWLDDAEGIDLDGWLIANGYPEDWVRAYPNGVPCRIITCPVDQLWRFGIARPD